MDADRDHRTAPPTPSLPPSITWFEAGARSYTAPLDPALLPPRGNAKLQRAWLTGFATAWFQGAHDSVAAPSDGDLTLYAALNSTLWRHRPLMLELMAIPVDTALDWRH